MDSVSIGTTYSTSCFVLQLSMCEQIGPMLTEDLMGGNAVVMFAYGLSG